MALMEQWPIFLICHFALQDATANLDQHAHFQRLGRFSYYRLPVLWSHELDYQGRGCPIIYIASLVRLGIA